MTEKNDSVAKDIRKLLTSQTFAVLATQGDGQPYTSLMAYAFTEDLKFIVVATAMSTRKHRNIAGESRVALLVDNRSNSGEDFQNATALTVVGKACEVGADERENFSGLYLARHPSLQKFLASPSTAFFKIEVSNYHLVSQFEDVVEYQIAD